tara:strand:+ start:1722 stop:1979 length:258 start_codon:yes stop_codon:yes gene_type:complete
MQHRCHADLSAKVLWIGSDSQERLGRCLEQQAIDRLLVLIADVDDLSWQREDHMEVLDRQQVVDARLYSVLRRSALTLRAVTIAA